MLAQDACAKAMEGRDGHGGRGFRGNHFADAMLHFHGRLVGKGQGQDLRRPADLFRHQAGYSICQNSGFAASGARKYEKGPVRVEHGFLLAFIKLVGKRRMSHRIPVLMHGEELCRKKGLQNNSKRRNGKGGKTDLN
jgi:hypothetical protein